MRRARALLGRAAMKSRFLLLALSFLATTVACGSGSGDEPPPAPSSGSSTNPNEPAGAGGSSGSTSTPPPSNETSSPCVAATKVLCERACACGTKGTCVVGYVTAGATKASVTEEHDLLSDCLNFYAL